MKTQRSADLFPDLIPIETSSFPLVEAQLLFHCVRVFALFSGGDDSLVSTHYAMNNGANEVVHINTGIGVDERSGLSVREFVFDTCAKYKWTVRELTPPDLTYRDMVLQYGFPGPGGHLYPYSWLKERAIAKLVRETKKKRSDRVGLSTGVRKTESARRMGYVAPIVRDGARVWIAPLYDKDKDFMRAYISTHKLERSPVVKLIGMSGECFCGAFAEYKELERKIRPNFPKLAARIEELQLAAKDARVHCAWGIRPRRDRKTIDLPFMPLCSNCNLDRAKARVENLLDDTK